MILENLKLTNFRNHKSLELEFVDGVNMITGQNGAGKTNILEGIYLLSSGKSFRARYDHEMIYNPKILGREKSFLDVFDGALTTKEFAKVVATVRPDSNEGTDSLDITITRDNPANNFSQKTFKLNGTPKRFYDLAGLFNCVLFAPQDLELFTGSPAQRRRFLDEILYKTDQKYKREHNIYTKVLRQRNKVLEKISATSHGRDELPFWTEKLLLAGNYIQNQRQRLIQNLNQMAGQIFSDISDQNQKVAINYKVNPITAERVEKHRQREVYAKTTLIGPHRDDFEFLLSDYDIGRFGSRGQQRAAVLSLKMAELNLVKESSKSLPLLLLDDIFSELDYNHKVALTRILTNQQTIFTSTSQEIKAEKTIIL